MTTEGGNVRVQLVGAFAIHGSEGADRTPRGRRACAIVAMLALAPDGKRARSWLQDKLWSSRAPEQGAASLRQSLHELRLALGDDRDLIVADKFHVLLDQTRCIIDLEADGAHPAGPDAELLEGLDISDDEFEDWLREQRAAFEKRRSSSKPQIVADAPVTGPTRHAADEERVLVLSRAPADQSAASILTDSLLDTVAKSIVELGVAKVYDRRAHTGQQPAELDEFKVSDAVTLRAESFDTEAKKIVRLALLQIPENSLAWSSTLQLSNEQASDVNDPRVKACINLVVNVAVDQFSKLHGSEPNQSLASALCRSGITHLFRLGRTNFATADTLFARAFEIEPRGVYLAWRAYLRTFLLAELQYTDRKTIEEEAFDFLRRALALEPYNSYVSALSAHVHIITRRSDAAAYELAERSIQLNHANPLGWAVLGVAESYLGKVSDGLRHTLFAREIAGYAPYRYQLDAFSFVASAVAGDTNRAIQLAEVCHALVPDFAPPIRYLTALYAYKGMHELSTEMVQKLQRSEPDFTLETLRDKAYPVWALHRTPIIAALPKRQI
jgi:DNA-binding SARP family transcriptional activator